VLAPSLPANIGLRFLAFLMNVFVLSSIFIHALHRAHEEKAKRLASMCMSLSMTTAATRVQRPRRDKEERNSCSR
jgi:hypothetical protein